MKLFNSTHSSNKSSKIIGLLTLLFAASSFSQESFRQIEEGGYKGTFRGCDRGPVHMMVKKYQGCKGCFLAFILDAPEIGDRDVGITIYSALPTEIPSQHMLVPFAVGSDHELTLVNEDPSYVLDMSRTSGREQFTLTNAQAGNKIGFQCTMVFEKNRESRFEVIQPQEGDLRLFGDVRKSGSIKNLVQSKVDLAHSMIFSWMGAGRETGGQFRLNERVPYLYTVAPIQYFATGAQVSSIPSKIGLFVKKGSKEMLLLVNPRNSKDIINFVVKE